MKKVSLKLDALNLERLNQGEEIVLVFLEVPVAVHLTAPSAEETQQL